MIVSKHSGRTAAVLFLMLFLNACATPYQTLQLRQADLRIPPVVELTQPPFYAQRDYQCGPAALATIINYYQQQTTPDALVSRIYIPQLKGSLQVEMLATVTSFRRLSIELDGRLASVLREVAAGHPVLVMQNLGLDMAPFWHYAVVIGYDLDKQQIVLRAGEVERLVRPFSVFERTWRRANNWALLAVPQNVMPDTVTEKAFVKAALALDAGQAWQNGVKRWPHNYLLQMGLGNSQFVEGDFAAAQRAFSTAVQVQPESVDALNNLAYALVRQGKKTQALETINQALQLDPQNANLRHSYQEISSTP